MEIIVFYCKIEKVHQQESHRFLRKAACWIYGEKNYDLAEREGGKPYFSHHPEICFSISHSGEYWTCAFSDTEIGLDIQIEDNRRQRERIAGRFFSAEEQTYLTECDYKEFYDIWAMKEAYLKYTGEGLARGLGKLSVVSGGRLMEVVSTDAENASETGRPGYLQKIDFELGYHMWICTEPPNGSITIRKRELF